MLKNAEDRREEGLACNILYVAYIVSMHVRSPPVSATPSTPREIFMSYSPELLAVTFDWFELRDCKLALKRLALEMERAKALYKRSKWV